ncbi:MAG: tetratricopeptide repeat protein [Pseudomonadota bacterium]|nr:tetratricopeptide repeat protein [Pseudomonadota bacterium]
MSDLEKVKNFVASISEKDLSNEELLQKSNEFFAENCSEIDAEFINKLLSAKKEGSNIGLELMEEYAYKGSPAAQLAIGAIKLEGKGFAKNVPEAIFWLKRSYIGKNPKSGFMLSSVYANGIGVAENMYKAREYLKGSADLGVPKAQYYYYAVMLIDGEGGAVDEELAVDYMLLAANNGYEDAITFLKENGLI